MTNLDLDSCRQQYKEAVERWVAAIRAEEALATPDHSETAMERWDDAALAEDGARREAKKARDRYQDALRKANFNF